MSFLHSSRRGWLKRATALLAGSTLAAPFRRAFGSPLASVYSGGSDPYVGEIIIVPYNFAPRGWALCNGQLLPIQQYTALFSLLGTTYGGNGQTNFAVPDLRDRIPMGFGNGPGLTPRQLGATVGASSHTLQPNEMPIHTHTISMLASSDPGTSEVPGGNYLASSANGVPQFSTTGGAVSGTTAALAGSAHENMQPSLAFNFIIATVGIFPPRS